MNNRNNEQFFKILDDFEYTTIICPMFVFPNSQILFHRFSFYGVLNEITLKKGEDREQVLERLSINLKALGDPRKFEILLSLKENKKYNLELADDLGISPSTMSHHMNVLLSCGLVDVNKQKGRVYYELDKSNVKKVIKQMSRLLELDEN